MPINKCKQCNVKSSFLYKCKCSNEYCIKDLLPEKHNCAEIELFRKDAYARNEKSLVIVKEKEEWIT